MRSDVDLLVVGDVDVDALHEAVDGAEQAIGREINPTVYSREEWAASLKMGFSGCGTSLRWLAERLR